MRLFLLSLIATLPSFGAITDLAAIDGATTTSQIAISYTVPSSATHCTIEVREDGSMDLMPDVDPALFADADDDIDRYPDINTGQTARQFVIGTQLYDREISGVLDSRSLAAATTYDIHLICGMDTADIELSTITVKFGNTYHDPPQPSDTYEGALQYPTIYDAPRGSYRIDPWSGAKYYRMTTPLDLVTSDDIVTNTGYFSVDASTDWTDPDNILTSDSTYATTSDTGWISLRGYPYWDPDGTQQSHLQFGYLHPSFIGFGDDSDPANRTIEWGIGVTVAGSCAASVPAGVTRLLVLNEDTPTEVQDDTAMGYNLMPPTALHQLTPHELYPYWCMLMRKTTTTGTISVDRAQWDGARGSQLSTGSGANYTISSYVPDDNDFYNFAASGDTNGSRSVLYKVKMTPTPEFHYLGMIPNYDGGQCITIGWSLTVADRFFCQPSSSNNIYQLDYTGDGTDHAAPHTAELDATLLTSDLPGEIEDFTVDHSGEYDFPFVPANFGCGFTGIVQGDDYLLGKCFRASQDSVAWLNVYKVGTGVTAAYPQWTQQSSRWCVYHSYEQIGNYSFYFWTTQIFKGGGAGQYYTALDGAINNSQTTITLTGQPMSATGDAYLMDIAVGDVIALDDSNGERVLVTDISMFPTITVERGYAGSTAVSHLNDADGYMHCAGYYDGPAPQVGTPQVLWDYINYPYGQDAGISNISYHGHETYRPGKGVNNNQYSHDDLMLGVDYPLPYSVTQIPAFDGWLPTGSGQCYETHATWFNDEGSMFGQFVFTDSRPIRGCDLMSANATGCDPDLLLPTSGGCPMAHVMGESDTYQYTFYNAMRAEGNSAPLGYKRMPAFGITGFSNAKNISGPGSSISDATPYTWCFALLADECVTGSMPGYMYMSTPTITYFGCNQEAGGGDGCIVEVETSSQIAEYNTTPPEMLGSSIRDIASVNSIAYSNRYSTGTSVKHQPDGEGLAFTLFRQEGSDVWMIKTPSYTASVDEVDRTTYFTLSATYTGSVPMGATRLLTKYGLTPDLECSPNRAEECYGTGTSFTEEIPFLWESELEDDDGLDVSGGCGGGCTIAMAIPPNKIGFYEFVWTNGMGSVVETSRMSVGGAEPGPPISSGGTRVGGRLRISGRARF